MNFKDWTPKDWAVVLGAIATVAVVYFRVDALESAVAAVRAEIAQQNTRLEQSYVRKDVFDTQMRLIDLQIQAATLKQETRK